MSDLLQQQQDDRTKRMFIGALANAVGISDQSYANVDGGDPVNLPAQYQVYGSTYGTAIEGKPVSTAQAQQSAVPLLTFAVIALVIWAIAK